MKKSIVILLFRGQRDRLVPHDGLLTVEGALDCSTYQSTNLPILSTLYEPLSKAISGKGLTLVE
jgi:hypothetical protein